MKSLLPPANSKEWPEPILWRVNSAEYEFTEWSFSGTLMPFENFSYSTITLVGREKNGRVLQWIFEDGYDLVAWHNWDRFPFGEIYWFKPQNARKIVAATVIQKAIEWKFLGQNHWPYNPPPILSSS